MRSRLALAWLGNAIWVVGQRDLGGGGGDTIWAGLGLAGRSKLGIGLLVELRLVALAWLGGRSLASDCEVS